MSGTVRLDESLGLVEARSQCVPKLGMGNPVLPVKLDEVDLARLAIDVGARRANLLLDVRWQLEGDGLNVLVPGRCCRGRIKTASRPS
jgi:hypothetical protein